MGWAILGHLRPRRQWGVERGAGWGWCFAVAERQRQTPSVTRKARGEAKHCPPWSFCSVLPLSFLCNRTLILRGLFGGFRLSRFHVSQWVQKAGQPCWAAALRTAPHLSPPLSPHGANLLPLPFPQVPVSRWALSVPSRLACHHKHLSHPEHWPHLTSPAGPGHKAFCLQTCHPPHIPTSPWSRENTQYKNTLFASGKFSTKKFSTQVNGFWIWPSKHWEIKEGVLCAFGTRGRQHPVAPSSCPHWRHHAQPAYSAGFPYLDLSHLPCCLRRRASCRLLRAQDGFSDDLGQLLKLPKKCTQVGHLRKSHWWHLPQPQLNSNH